MGKETRGLIYHLAPRTTKKQNKKKRLEQKAKEREGKEGKVKEGQSRVSRPLPVLPIMLAMRAVGRGGLLAKMGEEAFKGVQGLKGGFEERKCMARRCSWCKRG